MLADALRNLRARPVVPVEGQRDILVQPKQIWVRELVKKACVKLRTEELLPQWVEVPSKVQPRCTAKAGEITSLMERLNRDIPEFRRKQSLAYSIAGMLALIAEQRFPPSAHPAHPPHDPRAQPGPTRSPGAGLPGCQPAEGGLCTEHDALVFSKSPVSRRLPKCKSASYAEGSGAFSVLTPSGLAA